MIRTGPRPEDWSVTCESELEDGWTLTGVFRLRDGRVRLDEPVRLAPADDEDTIEGLKAATRRMRMSWVARMWESRLVDHYHELPQEWREGFRPSPRPGRAGHPVAFYALWVDRYLTACAEHEKPTQALVESFPGESAQSISRYLQRADRLGLIEDRPGRGKAGGMMTDRCRRVLAGEEH